MLVWIALSVAFLVVLGFFISTNLANVRRLPRLEFFDDPQQPPRVSVIVPARNEEANIGRCVGSLLGQDYPAFQVIVVNDNSTDGTLGVLGQLAKGDHRLTVVDGRPLPDGWVGKNWACAQGVAASDGEILVFTDADTFHRPEALSKAVSALRAGRADFLTAITRQETGSLGERTVVPVVFWLAYSVFPFALMNRYSTLPLSFGNGQFMMMDRSAYERTGGYESIRGNAFDDMMLARLMRSRGLRTVVVDGSCFISCRMYRSMRETFRGLTRNIYLLFRHSFPRAVAAPLYFLLLSVLAAVFLGPLTSVAAVGGLLLLGIAIPKLVLALAVLAVLQSLATFAIVSLRFNYPFFMIFAYPASLVLFLVIAASSFLLTTLRKTTWKGRALHSA